MDLKKYMDSLGSKQMDRQLVKSYTYQITQVRLFCRDMFAEETIYEGAHVLPGKRRRCDCVLTPYPSSLAVCWVCCSTKLFATVGSR